ERTDEAPVGHLLGGLPAGRRAAPRRAADPRPPEPDRRDAAGGARPPRPPEPRGGDPQALRGQCRPEPDRNRPVQAGGRPGTPGASPGRDPDQADGDRPREPDRGRGPADALDPGPYHGDAGGVPPKGGRYEPVPQARRGAPDPDRPRLGSDRSDRRCLPPVARLDRRPPRRERRDPARCHPGRRCGQDRRPGGPPPRHRGRPGRRDRRRPHRRAALRPRPPLRPDRRHPPLARPHRPGAGGPPGHRRRPPPGPQPLPEPGGRAARGDAGPPRGHPAGDGRPLRRHPDRPGAALRAAHRADRGDGRSAPRPRLPALLPVQPPRRASLGRRRRPPRCLGTRRAAGPAAPGAGPVRVGSDRIAAPGGRHRARGTDTATTPGRPL
ncbi:MAG: hypothetical protein AVDCRST_MAG59-2229, partial [uncultured Thermomicrobiales bacterium]